MSHFYGTLEGSRGEASRCGSKDSGITTYAAGWSGAIRVHVWQDEAGNDCFDVDLVPWQSSGGRSQGIARGRLNATVEHITKGMLPE